MRGLFLRIFVSFWLAILVIAIGSYVLFELERPSNRWAQRRILLDEMQRIEGELAFAVLRDRGRDAAETELRELQTRSGVAIHLVHDGAIVASPTPPDGLVRRAATAPLTDERLELEREGRAALVIPLANGDRAVATRERATTLERFLGSAAVVPFRILLIALVGGLVAYWLARYLSRPLRRLREATQRISAGDLDVRVRGELAGATEEVAALGDDFDRMTERVSSLLEAQRRLLRDVSHELRSPLARLQVALELARRGPDAAPHLDRIEKEAHRLGDLIGQILTLTRLEGDDRRDETVAIHELLEEIVHDVDYEARGRGRQVRLGANPAITLRGTAEVLRAAIENVLRNAVRFTPEGGTVDVEATLDPETLTIVVRDRGPGVPPEELEAIFRPFYRVSTARERSSGGSGVGLAITARAAKMHGGTVSAANAPDGGLEVTFRLPRTRA